MPIYEYECLEQKHRFEVIQKFSDPPVTHCTVCGGIVQRLLSSPAIQFKGSGWYITDYARKGGTGASSSASESSSSSTSESKPPSTDTAKSDSASSSSDSKTTPPDKS